MNRRDILAVLGIGATGLAGTESITARAASMNSEHMNHPDSHGLHPHVPQIDLNGPARQRAIADALESLARELRVSAESEEVRHKIRERQRQLVDEAKAHGVENPDVKLTMPEPIDEVWAISLQTKSTMNGNEWLQHQIVVDVELHHAA